MSKAWPSDDPWYDYTRNVIYNFIMSNASITSDAKVLNAGSGGSTYGLKTEMYHVDLADKLIEKFPKHYVCSVENMPFEDAFFEYVICVGSVINYNDALSTISEISRVMSNDAKLILEYERSLSGELLFKKDYGKSATIQLYNYNGYQLYFSHQ